MFGTPATDAYNRVLPAGAPLVLGVFGGVRVIFPRWRERQRGLSTLRHTMRAERSHFAGVDGPNAPSPCPSLEGRGIGLADHQLRGKTVQLIVELEGVLFDVREAYWAAYSAAVEAIGLARTDPGTLWRLVRTGAGDEMLVRGARPHQLEKFRKAFEAALESDEALAKYVPQDDVRESLRLVRELGAFSGATCGSNVAARHGLLRANGLAEMFPQLNQTPSPASAGAAALREIAARRSEEKVVVVLAATVGMARCADEAGMVPIGISCGPAIGKRLGAAGVRATYADVAAFGAALGNREEGLRRAGLVF